LCLGFAALGFQSQVSVHGADPALPSLTAGQIVKNLEEKNQERASALREFQGTRVYRMEYQGFPSNRDAEMVVNVMFHAPAKKEFAVVSETGSKFIISHVFKKLLEGEQEAGSEENRRRTALNTTNYDFALVGTEASSIDPQYILSVAPKTANKFLYRGKIWVDAKDFAVTRIDAEPAKNPSFWIKKNQLQHKYKKVGEFWLPEENRTESWIRLGGRAVLTIEYKDYKVSSTQPPATTEHIN